MKRTIIMAVLAVMCGGQAFAGTIDTFSTIDNLKAAAPVSSALKQKAEKAIVAIKDKDFFGLAQLVDPKLGLRFSPDAYIPSNGVVMSKDKVANFFNDNRKYTWGAEEGTGFPMVMPPSSYYKKYIYTMDFIALDPVYNGRGGNTNMGNILEICPGALIADFYYPGTAAMGNNDWRSLRLVFNRDLYLVAIVYGAWSI